MHGTLVMEEEGEGPPLSKRMKTRDHKLRRHKLLLLALVLLSTASLRFHFSSGALRLRSTTFLISTDLNLALHHLPPPPPPPPSGPSAAILLPDSSLLLLLRPHPYLHPQPHPPLLCLFPSSTTATPAGFLPSSHRHLLVRCPIPSSLLHRRQIPSPNLTTTDHKPYTNSTTTAAFHWNFLVYESTSITSDVVLFAKGVNNRRASGRPISDLRCVFNARDSVSGAVAVARTAVTSSAQEVFRCHHPELADASRFASGDVEVTLEVKGSVVPSVARYTPPPAHDNGFPSGRSLLCASTMVRNVAKFLSEWVTYHSRIGVNRFILYDNGSEDGLDRVVSRLAADGHNISTYLWPWPKTQEAGFSHAAVSHRGTCEWMMYLDVDEFLYSPDWVGSDVPNRDMLPDLLRSVLAPVSDPIGQVTINCRDFGPSGLSEHPVQGVTQGYTCRRKAEERHKSLVRLDSVDGSLLNVVHHFRLKKGWGVKRLGSTQAVVNHYKYQAWPEFRNKFKGRAAAYVVDWTRAVNAGSKDRAPGLGFKAVEPKDWPRRFCELRDTHLKEVTRRWFGRNGPNGSNRLAWQEES